MGQPYVVPYQTGTAYTDQGSGGRSQGDWQAAIMTPVTSATLTGTENAYGTVDSSGRVAIYYPSAARTATPYSPSLYTRGTEGVTATVNVSAVVSTPSVVFALQGYDPGSASWYNLIASGAVSTTGMIQLSVSPGLTPIPAQSWSTAVTTEGSQANPAAAADFVITVPAGQQWVDQTLTAVLTASATVANRVVTLIIDDGAGHNVWQSAAGTAQTAGQVVTYTWALPAGTTLQPGWRIRSSTTGLSAGDQWSAIAYSYGLSTLVNNSQMAASAVIPDTVRFTATHGNANSITYSVGLDWQ